jgi:hypothetical protein
MSADVGGGRPPLQFSPESSRLLGFPGLYLRPPTKFLEKRVCFAFHGVGGDLAQDRCKFEPMSAIPG